MNDEKIVAGECVHRCEKMKKSVRIDSMNLIIIPILSLPSFRFCFDCKMSGQRCDNVCVVERIIVLIFLRSIIRYYCCRIIHFMVYPKYRINQKRESTM